MADFDVKKLTTPAECRSFMKNARRHKREDLHVAAFRRLCELENGENPLKTRKDDPDPIVVEFWRAIIALEEVRHIKHGRAVRASRVRQKVERDGIPDTIESLVLAKKPGEGFKWLVEAGLGDLTVESIVTRHPSRFSPEVISAAKSRLQEHGLIGQ